MNRCAMLVLVSATVLGPAVAAAQSGTTPADGAAAGNALTILWTERRPFQYTDDDGQIKGLLVDLGRRIFAQAEIPVTWAEVPANRVIQQLKDNRVPTCAVGWYKNPEREAIAQFSQAVYRDLPLRAVLRSNAPIEASVLSREILDDAGLRLLLKQGFAYGPFLDARLAQLPEARIQRSVGDARNLLQMLQAQRADVVFLSQEEIDHYGRTLPDFQKQFKVVAFKDAPAAEQRYIMCNGQVSAGALRRINSAIAAQVRLK